MTRRRLLLGGAGALLAATALAGLRHPPTAAAAGAGPFEITRTEAEWRRLLTASAYRVLRGHGTEPPYSSPLNEEKRPGIYACAGCALPLFSSRAKFESGTGWPSFLEPLPAAVGTAEDTSFFMRRTEVHCRRCGGQLGHVFDDGPPPTRLRYCINGVALSFVPGPEAPGAAS